MANSQEPIKEEAPLSIRKGSSLAKDPAVAAEELHRAILQPNCALAVFFCSSNYDLPTLASSLRSYFGDLPLIGCTTAGEIAPGGYQSGGLSGFSLAGPEFAAATMLIDDLENFTVTEGRERAEVLLRKLDTATSEANGDNTFAFFMIDGMSQRTEIVVNALHSGLRDIPLFGGSAGCSPADPAETRTLTYFAGQFREKSAILAAIKTSRPFVVFKTENFVPTVIKMVVTEAQPASRKVLEINGLPAAPEYMRLAGMPAETPIMAISATHPAAVQLGGQLFLRAIGWAGEDQSITFFCALDEGAILTIASEVDFIENLRQEFESIHAKVGTPDLVVACDCFSRLLDMERKGIKEKAGSIMSANNAIGFNTYGEQFNSLHMNQTLTGVAIGKAGQRQHASR